MLIRLVTVLLVCLCTFGNTLSARSLSQIKASGEIRICLVPIHPSVASATPENCRENCQFKGTAYEESLLFAKSLGKSIRPRFLRIEWPEQFYNKAKKVVLDGRYVPHLIASGTCDLYPNNLESNLWRLKKLDAVMLFPSRLMVLTHSTNTKSIQSIGDLSGKTAGVEVNTSFHGWLLQFNQNEAPQIPVTIKLMKTGQALSLLNRKKIDFTILDADAAIWTTKYDYPQIRAVFTVGPLKRIGWMFGKKDKDLQEAVQAFFTKQRQDPDSAYNRLWKKYYGVSLTDYIRLVSAIR